ncbi:MAG: BF3164 family lipoprotein [Melioribacteraceae bacterium]
MIILNNCSNNSKFEKSTELRAEEIIDGDSLGFPFEIISMNDLIIILDKKPLIDNSTIKVYDHNYHLITSFGKRGKGPGEYLQPVDLTKSIGIDYEFTLYDFSNLRLTNYKIDRNYQFHIKNIYPLKGGMPYQAVFTNDKIIVSLGLGLEYNRIAIFDTNGTIKKTIGEIPPGKEKNTPVPLHLQAYKGKLRLSPDGKYYVISAQYSDYIDILNKAGNLKKRIIGPLDKEPEYDVVSAGEIPVMALDTKKCIYGYLDIAVNDEFIYALYSGNQFSDHKYEGNFIHVYDFNGQLKKNYKLTESIVDFDIDFHNAIIYGIKINPNIKVYKFKLM